MSQETKTTEDNSHDLFAVRKGKLDAMRALGYDPFRQNWEQTHTSKEAIESFDMSIPEGENSEHEVSVAGRVMVFRLMGKASFVKIRDRDGDNTGLLRARRPSGGRVQRLVQKISRPWRHHRG